MGQLIQVLPTIAANLVLITPGAIAFTLIFSGASALDIALVNPSNAVFVTEYDPMTYNANESYWKMTYQILKNIKEIM